MADAEGLLAAITAQGEKVKTAKSDKTRSAADNQPLIDELLRLKAECVALFNAYASLCQGSFCGHTHVPTTSVGDNVCIQATITTTPTPLLMLLLLLLSSRSHSRV
jgi:hypothetical protein